MSSMQLHYGTQLLEYQEYSNVKLQCYDMRDAEIGNSNKSYTLNIPMTRGNIAKLGSIQQINSRKNLTEPMRLSMNGFEVIRGTAKVMNINSEVLTVIIDADEWVGLLPDVSIKDLNWAAGDAHEFTSANVVASWSGTDKAYRYVHLEMNRPWERYHGSVFYPHDYIVMWQISTIVKKIFADAGYTLASEFFDDAEIVKLYILAQEIIYPDTFITGKALEVQVDSNNDNKVSVTHSTLPAPDLNYAVTKDPVQLNDEVTDEGGDYSTGTDTYTAPETGTYRFTWRPYIKSEPSDDPDTTIVSAENIVKILKNGSTVLVERTDTGIDVLDTTPDFEVDTGWVHLEAGDEITCYWEVDLTANTATGLPRTMSIYITAGSVFEAVWDYRNKYAGLGKSISPADTLPDINTLDFLRALKSTYNLKFWVDQLNKKVYINHGAEFVGSTVIDWSNKVDYSKEIKQQVLAQYYRTEQYYKYAPDTSDRAYNEYVESYAPPFTYLHTLTNTSAKQGRNTRTSIFSPTVGSGNWLRIYGSAEQYEVSPMGGTYIYPWPEQRTNEFNPRIVEWQGMVSLVSGIVYYYPTRQGALEYDGSKTDYTTQPKILTPDYEDIFAKYWAKDFHYINTGRVVTIKVNLKPNEATQFITAVGSATNNGFRATYKFTIDGISMYFFITKITLDGNSALIEMVQKM